MGDIGIDGSIILNWILEKYIWGCGLDSSGHVIGSLAGMCEEPLDSIQGREIFGSQ